VYEKTKVKIEREVDVQTRGDIAEGSAKKGHLLRARLAFGRRHTPALTRFIQNYSNGGANVDAEMLMLLLALLCQNRR